MGSGKSSLARHLARLTARRWIDTDRMVSQRAGRSIPEIFQQEGEEAFRRLEEEALVSLSGTHRLVVATGGGIVVRSGNVARLRHLGCVIFLSASVEVLFERVSRNQQRPLLHTPDPEGTMRDLLACRLPLYTACAHFAVNTSGGTHEDLAREVVARSREFFAGNASR